MMSSLICGREKLPEVLAPEHGPDHVVAFCHLSVVVNVDDVDGPVSVADEEHRVVIGLQHLQEVHVCPTVDENKVAELQQQCDS